MRCETPAERNGISMFTKFFYTCRAKGLRIALTEWLALQEALEKGLAGSSLTEFYYLARMILVKSETDFDKFDINLFSDSETNGLSPKSNMKNILSHVRYFIDVA